jgi:hypothetical protein
VSWLWPELMDVDHFKLSVLNDAEQSKLRKAQKTAKNINEFLKDWCTNTD